MLTRDLLQMLARQASDGSQADYVVALETQVGTASPKAP